MQTAQSYGGASYTAEQLPLIADLERLSTLATAALTSPEKEVRDSAAQQLLFLSSYDNWDAVKLLFPLCKNNYLRFIVCKAIHFIVSNELGPQERSGMQQYVLDYLRNARECQEALPNYVRNELYSIYASALYSNWKLAIISTDGESQEESSAMAAQIIDVLHSYLETPELLDCMLEVVTYFARQDSKLVILSVSANFARFVLPHFFGVATDLLTVVPTKAAEVCATILECIPSSNTPLMQVRFTTDPSVYLTRWEGWASALPRAMDICGSALLQDPLGDESELFSRLLRQCSTVMCAQEAFIAARDGLVEKVIGISTSILLACRENESMLELLRLACALLVNAFERNEVLVSTYFVAHSELIDTWAEATQFVVERWVDDEDELRQSLMHLCFLFAENLLPAKPTAMSVEELTAASVIAEARGLNGSPAAHTNERKLSPTRCVEVEHLIMIVFLAYFNNVVAKAHLREDSDELRTETGVVLHNEKTLLPLAEMLLCDSVDLLPMVVERLEYTIEQYEGCVRAREQGVAAAEGGAFGAGATSGVDELFLSLAMEHLEVANTIGGDGTPLYLMYVCLSRLSVLISTVAIAIVNGASSGLKNDAALRLIAGFARRLLTDDDQLTNSLLQCLSLLDEGGGSGGALDDGNKENQRAPAVGEAKVHLGVLRALFFFCGCVYNSEFSRRPEFYDIALHLLRFVYLFHSDDPCLMVDANTLLLDTVTRGISGTSFLGSNKLMAVIQAVKDDKMDVIRFSFDAGAALSPRQLQARNGFYVSFVSFVETRYYAGYPIGDVLVTMLHRTLSGQRMFSSPSLALNDLVAITEGCHQADSLINLLEAVAANKTTLLEVIQNATSCAPQVIQWFARLCSLTGQRLDEEVLSLLQWELASLILNSMCLYFSFLSRPTAASGGCGPDESAAGGPRASQLFSFPLDVVNASVVYDVADVLESLCARSWCNVGVLMYYERVTVERFFCGAIELLMSTSVQMLMSTKSGAQRVFRSIIAALCVPSPTFDQLHLLFMRHGMWTSLLARLTRCLHYAFAPEVLQLMLLVLQSNHLGQISIPKYEPIDSATLAAAFHEVAILIAVAPHLELRELAHCFGILQSCFAEAPGTCGDRMDELLEYCSAYHRVRLRMIMTMLRSNRPDVMEAYLSVFGQSSKVGVLAAW